MFGKYLKSDDDKAKPLLSLNSRDGGKVLSASYGATMLAQKGPTQEEKLQSEIKALELKVDGLIKKSKLLWSPATYTTYFRGISIFGGTNPKSLYCEINDLTSLIGNLLLNYNKLTDAEKFNIVIKKICELQEIIFNRGQAIERMCDWSYGRLNKSYSDCWDAAEKIKVNIKDHLKHSNNECSVGESKLAC